MMIETILATLAMVVSWTKATLVAVIIEDELGSCMLQYWHYSGVLSLGYIISCKVSLVEDLRSSTAWAVRLYVMYYS